MRLNALAAGAAVATLALAASPAPAQDFLSAPLLMGVYDCHDQTNTRRKELMFALLDDSSYNDYLGVARGYTYDPSTGILEIGMETGGAARYLRIYEHAFRGIDENGELLGFTCPLNTMLDPIHPRW